MPPGDAHVRHLDVSSFLGPASMVERHIGSTTRQRGVYGGEFLQQGFAYKQSGGREEGSRTTRVGGEGVRGWCAPTPLYIEGGRSPSPSPKPKPAAPKDKEWGARKPPLLEGLSRV